MAPPTVTVSGINVRVSWTAPNSNGSPITAYKIRLLESDGDYSEVLASCDGSNALIISQIFCDIPMSTLRAAPFSLSYGAVVRARVSAFNANGWNTESLDNVIGPSIQTAPTQMSAPTRGSLTSEYQIEV